MTALDHRALKRWRADPIAFVEEVLVDPETGRPFVLLLAERDFIGPAFATGPDGRLLYPEQIYSAPKKSGKTTFAGIATITMVVLHGGAYPEGTCCANDLEQSVGRVFQMIKRIVEASPLLRREARIGADKITFPAFHDAAISAIASDAAGAAGGNPTISTFDELWGVTSERARRLFDEMVPSPARQISCRLVVTYAGFDTSVLLLELHKRGMALPEIAPGLRAGDGMLMAWHHEPVAPWQTDSWLADMRRSLRPAQYLRMIENRFVSSESSFVDMAHWDACVDADARPVLADRSLSVWIGVDASVKRDSTAIVCCSWDDAAKKVRLVAHRVFQPTAAEPIDFETMIEHTVLDFARRFHVMEVRFDPYQMQGTAQRLARQGNKVEEYPQTVPNLTTASQNLYELVSGRNIAVYADAGMRLAISRAVAVEMPRGWKISKEKQTHKVDVVVRARRRAVPDGDPRGLDRRCRVGRRAQALPAALRRRPACAVSDGRASTRANARAARWPPFLTERPNRTRNRKGQNMTTRSSKLAAALKSRFGSPKALLRALGLDENLADVGKPASGGAPNALMQMRNDLEALLGNLGPALGEAGVRAVLEVLDAHSPVDQLPDDDRYSKPAGVLAGNDDDNLAQVRALLKKAGLSEDDISEALRLAAGGDASDVLPTSGPGGLGGAVTGRTRSPGERVFAADERRRAAQLAYDKTFPNAVVVGVGYSPDRERERPRSWPSEAAIENYNKRFGGEHIGTNG